ERVPAIAIAPILAAPSPHAAPAGRPGAAAIEVRRARKTYGKMAALDGVDVTVAAGTIHGLVGPNGSGKTTLLNVVSGLIRLDAGSVAVRGRDMTGLPAYAAARLGLGRTFQTPRVFEEMSIWDNLRLGSDFSERGEDA